MWRYTTPKKSALENNPPERATVFLPSIDLSLLKRGDTRGDHFPMTLEFLWTIPFVDTFVDKAFEVGFMLSIPFRVKGLSLEKLACR